MRVPMCGEWSVESDSGGLGRHQITMIELGGLVHKIDGFALSTQLGI